MDFFARQEDARRRTGWLVVMFFGAIAGIIGTVYAGIGLLYEQGLKGDTSSSASTFNPMWSMEAMLTVSGVISLIVLGGTAYKLAQLRHGGVKVAEMLGGRAVNPSSNQFHERRLLNIVEEMALASGVPVPPVYVMPGQMGINAFAAGYTIHDAVIGVTEGTMRGLKREELQGVIAHEYSHILNGDMRLNIRLIGIVHGLLVLAIVGQVLVRTAFYTRPRRSKKDEGGAAIVIGGLGVALMIVGYLGYFFGGLIKRAISRQREYLADASAVQFTRNPLGLAEALKKVGGLSQGGQIKNAHAEELSHMFFADGIKRFFGAGSLFATHPPLTKRIKALDPQFDGKFTPLTEDSLYLSGQEQEKPDTSAAKKAAGGEHGDFIRRTMVIGGAMAADPAGILGKIGVLEAAQLDDVSLLMASIPEDIRMAVHEPIGAQSVLLALLLGASGEEPTADAWAWLPASFSGAVSRYLDKMSGISSRHRLALVDMAMPAIRSLNTDQATRFLDLVEKIIHADQKVNLFEFAVQEIVRSGLREVLKVKMPTISVRNIDKVIKDAALLMNLMATAGSREAGEAEKAFAAGAGKLGEHGLQLHYQPGMSHDMDKIKTALDHIMTSVMPVRRQILDAMLACLQRDGNIDDEEFELFRAFAAALEVPVPPLSAA
jgi:Zn-dependent protease with chaperone function